MATHVVVGKRQSAEMDDSRVEVICPDCQRNWACLFIPTAKGDLYDVVECDCGAYLKPSDDIINEYQKEHGPSSYEATIQYN